MAYEFMGYVRPDGQVGCRNHVAVIPSVTCAGDVASAIVRQVAEEHQGEITVESKVGKGTSITVFFPLRRREEKAE